MTLQDRAVRLVTQFIDTIRNLLSPQHPTGRDENQESIAHLLASLSADRPKYRQYTAEEFYAEFMKPLRDARAEALGRADRPPHL
jgi:hypothetical protein